MKNNILFPVLIMLLFINSIFGQDKNQAINDFLQTIISDYNQEIIIKKEKTNPNITLDLFKGRAYKDSIGHLKREGGVSDLLYNEKDWNRMKKKYYYDENSEKKYFTKNIFWTSNDFKYKNIYFVPYKDYLDLVISRSEQRHPIVKFFSFSDPIYYSCKRYLVFAVSEGNSESIGNYDHYIIVMKKENNKWIVVEKIYPSNVYE
jgi:hypothetical protein